MKCCTIRLFARQSKFSEIQCAVKKTPADEYVGHPTMHVIAFEVIQ